MTLNAVAGSAGRRMRSRAWARLIVALGAVALLGLPAAPAAKAAGPTWYDGSVAYSSIINCQSIIWPPLRFEYGASAYVGFWANPDAGQPAPGSTYYIHVVVYGLGNSCSGQRFVPEIVLPASTSLAISPGNPVYCFAGGVADACPQSLAAGPHGGYRIWSYDTAHANLWPLPQGGNWEFQIPVVSSVALTNSTFGAYVEMADGNDNPTLVATQGAYVFGGTPTVLYPTPSTEGITQTYGKSTANLYTGGLAGNAWFDLGTTTGYGLVTDGPIAIDTSFVNYYVWDDWQPVSGPSPLQPNTLYHWRLRYQASGVWYVGADQTFRTAGATLQVSGISGGPSGTTSSVTVAAKSGGVTDASYRGSIRFTSTDTAARLPLDYSFTAGDAGSHTFTSGVTMRNAGTWSVTATDTVNATITGAQGGIAVTATAPGAPTGATATPGNARATVSWTAPSSYGGSPITGYTATSTPGGRTCATTGALTCTVTGLTNGAAYTFRVTAANAVGTGPASAASAAVTPRVPTTPFTDISGSMFKADILWVYNAGITTGCTPTKYCPDGFVTREQMASFLARSLHLTGAAPDAFSDDETSIHEANINLVAKAGIASGCALNKFCPTGLVSREQMASFLARALHLTGAAPDAFTDDETSIHEPNINLVARDGIATGCGNNKYCPVANVTRGQMAAFLHRAFGP